MGRGGDLSIYRESIKLITKPLLLPDQSSFELLAVKLRGPTPTIIAVLYRKTTNIFITEHQFIMTILSILSAMSLNIILMGIYIKLILMSLTICLLKILRQLDRFDLTTVWQVFQLQNEQNSLAAGLC